MTMTDATYLLRGTRNLQWQAHGEMGGNGLCAIGANHNTFSAI